MGKPHRKLRGFGKMEVKMVEMKKTVESCDLPVYVAAKAFEMLNEGKVVLEVNIHEECVLVTDAKPDELIYPKGWYYAKGCFRNKHNTTKSIYEEAKMYKRNGDPWNI